MNRKMIKFILGAAIGFLIIKSCSVGKPQLPPGIEIASDFGSKTDALGRTRSQTHQGIDIIGPVGTEIIAIADGHVLAAEEESCWGLTIMIEVHDNLSSI